MASCCFPGMLVCCRGGGGQAPVLQGATSLLLLLRTSREQNGRQPGRLFPEVTRPCFSCILTVESSFDRWKSGMYLCSTKTREVLGNLKGGGDGVHNNTSSQFWWSTDILSSSILL